MAETKSHRQHMAEIFPHLYHPTTPEEAAVAARPIAGMLFAVDQKVRDRRTWRTGTVDHCTAFPNGALRYAVAWDNGDMASWVWEPDLSAIERPLGCEEAERQRAAEGAGTAETASSAEGERSAASTGSPSLPTLRTPSAVFARQLKSLVATARRYIPDA